MEVMLSPVRLQTWRSDYGCAAIFHFRGLDAF